VISLQEEFEAARKPDRTNFLEWLRTLPDDDQKRWADAATDRRLSNAALVRIASGHGAAIGKDRMAAWRSENGFTR